MTAWIIAIGRMLGLGSIAGIRPSLTLAVIGVVGYFDWGIEPNSTFTWLSYWWVIGIFVVLAILESTFDKISKLDRLQDRLIMPYRLVMGGVAGAATVPFGWKGIVVGAAIGAGAAWFSQYTKHITRPRSRAERGRGDAHQRRRGPRARSSAACSSSPCRTSGTPAGASPGSSTGARAAGGGPSTRRCAGRRRPAPPRPMPTARGSGACEGRRDRGGHARVPELRLEAARPPAGRLDEPVSRASRRRRRWPLTPRTRAVRRLRMVEEQLVRRGLRDEDVLAAMRSVPRHLFVPGGPAVDAYADTPLPIGLGQTISQPYMVALMTSLLEVDVRSRVLEVGAGSGYQTAVLAEVAGEVFAVERLATLAERARATLARLGYDNVRLAIGDGARGWHEQAPFQGILVAAAADEVPPELLGQLADGGRLIVPVGRGRGDQVLTIVERDGDSFQESLRHALPLRAARPRRQLRRAAQGRDARQRCRRRRGLVAARRRGRPRRQRLSGGGGRHEVRRRQSQWRRAGRVLSGQRPPRGRAARPARLGAQRERRLCRPCTCRAPPRPSTPCSTGAAWGRRRRACRGSRSPTLLPMRLCTTSR